MRKKISILFAVAILVISCATANNTMNSIKSKLGKKQVSVENTQWILMDNNLGTTKAPTLILESGRVSGNASCNNYFAEMTQKPEIGEISIKNIGSTKMACENMSVENNYLQMLEQANKYVQEGTTLELYKNNLLLLKFRKQ